MTWIEIGKSHLAAAKVVLDEHPRSSASRAYYAAHVVLADFLIRAGALLTPGRQTPSHNSQPALIGAHLSGRGQTFVREARAVIRRLYARRIDADYKRTVTVDRSAALDSIRDASTLFELFGVR